MWGLLFHLGRKGEHRPAFQALASFPFPEAQPPNAYREEQDPWWSPMLLHTWNQDLEVSARVRSRRRKACHFSKKSPAAGLLPSIAGCCGDRKKSRVPQEAEPLLLPVTDRSDSAPKPQSSFNRTCCLQEEKKIIYISSFQKCPRGWQRTIAKYKSSALIRLMTRDILSICLVFNFLSTHKHFSCQVHTQILYDSLHRREECSEAVEKLETKTLQIWIKMYTIFFWWLCFLWVIHRCGVAGWKPRLSQRQSFIQETSSSLLQCRLHT